MSVVAIIPARGGSKGIPKKNLRKINGRSLVHRAVAAAKNAVHVDAVFVSTDDPLIEEEAQTAGALVIRRPPELSGDDASSESALLHALEVLREQAIDPEVTVFIQCTSPFTQADDVDAVVALVAEPGVDSAFTARPFHGFVWRSAAGGVRGVNHDHTQLRERRQDRSEELLETGAVYAFRTAGFLATRSRFFGRIEAVKVDPRRALEIDEQADLDIAKSLAAPLDRAAVKFPPRGQVPRLIVLDFDGVLTDNRVVVDEEGSEAVVCHRGDGHGLAKLRAHVPVIVLSTEVNPVVSARCLKLGIECLQGLGEGKLAALEHYVAEKQVGLDDVLFVGNDVNDVECLKAVGMAVSVADAVPDVLAVSDLVLTERGGHGAVRELCDLLLPLYTG